MGVRLKGDEHQRIGKLDEMRGMRGVHTKEKKATRNKMSCRIVEGS